MAYSITTAKGVLENTAPGEGGSGLRGPLPQVVQGPLIAGWYHMLGLQFWEHRRGSFPFCIKTTQGTSPTCAGTVHAGPDERDGRIHRILSKHSVHLRMCEQGSKQGCIDEPCRRLAALRVQALERAALNPCTLCIRSSISRQLPSSRTHRLDRRWIRKVRRPHALNALLGCQGGKHVEHTDRGPESYDLSVHSQAPAQGEEADCLGLVWRSDAVGDFLEAFCPELECAACGGVWVGGGCGGWSGPGQ